MAEHSTLTGSDLHEPKGAATAASGKVYVADGAGSGEWLNPVTGWGYYEDSGATQSVGTAPVQLVNNGAGTSSNSAYLPLDIRGVGELYNTVTGLITPIKLGDAYDIRVGLPVVSETGTPTLLTAQLDISGGVSPTIVVATSDVVLGKTPPYQINITFPIFCLSTFMTNGGQIFLSTDSGTVVVDSPSLLVVRTHSEVS